MTLRLRKMRANFRSRKTRLSNGTCVGARPWFNEVTVPPLVSLPVAQLKLSSRRLSATSAKSSRFLGTPSPYELERHHPALEFTKKYQRCTVRRNRVSKKKNTYMGSKAL